MKLRALTYNIKSCRGISGVASLPAVALAIALTGADIAGLQEVDYCNPRSGFQAQARKIGKILGMQSVFGANATWFLIARQGNAVLSRYPIQAVQNFPLASTGEKRGLLKVVIKTNLYRVLFFTTHLGLDQRERLHQVEEIKEIISQEKDPLILTGDFNALPGAEEIQKIQTMLLSADPTGAWPTFPSTLPQHKIDYIFYTKHWRLIESRVYESMASDHLPWLVVLELDHEKINLP